MTEPTLQRDYGQPGTTRPVNDRMLVLVAYLLHLFGPLTAFVLNIAALVINYLRRDEALPDLAAHHRWMIRTFWWGLLWFMVCAILHLVLIGYFLSFILLFWWIYRHLRGLFVLYEHRSLPA
jgi:uncharacterized membrane protein